MKNFKHHLLLLYACVFVGAASIYTEEAPSWVNSIRSGNITLKVKSGNKILFRSNVPANKKLSSNELCDLAIQKNVENIRKAYPNVDNIPMTTEMIFYDPKLKDCSTTISVSKNIEEKNKKVDLKKKNLEKNLNKANDENNDLQKQIMDLRAKLKEVNKSKDEKIDLQNQIIILQEKLREADKVKEEKIALQKQIEELQKKLKEVSKKDKKNNVKDSNYQIFYSEGLPKTNNRKYSLEYPKNWDTFDNNSKFIVKQLHSPKKFYPLCQVVQGVENNPHSVKELEYIFKNDFSSFLKKYEYDQLKILSGHPSKIAGKPAIIFDSIYEKKGGWFTDDVQMKHHYAIIYDGFDYFMLTCTTGNINEDFSKEFKHFVNSFTLLDTN